MSKMSPTEMATAAERTVAEELKAMSDAILRL